MDLYCYRLIQPIVGPGKDSGKVMVAGAILTTLSDQSVII